MAGRLRYSGKETPRPVTRAAGAWISYHRLDI